MIRINGPLSHNNLTVVILICASFCILFVWFCCTGLPLASTKCVWTTFSSHRPLSSEQRTLINLCNINNFFLWIFLGKAKNKARCSWVLKHIYLCIFTASKYDKWHGLNKGYKAKKSCIAGILFFKQLFYFLSNITFVSHRNCSKLLVNSFGFCFPCFFPFLQITPSPLKRLFLISLSHFVAIFMSCHFFLACRWKKGSWSDFCANRQIFGSMRL